MKKLFLLRHADAPFNSSQSDFDRALSKKGKEECLYLNKYFLNNPVPELILCSNAIRTKQTAEIVLNNLSDKTNLIFKQELYNSSINNLISIIEDTNDDINTLMVIGHNPSITLLSEILSPTNKHVFPEVSDYAITAKLVVLNIDTNNWFPLTNYQTSILDLVFHKTY
ncbi:SixA phosphatase family protein [Candidatus Jidaibacter acanthamoebae]|nr:histidine phosphatase family protein [Candidatus Jidaibacter acanthamoeba]